MDDSRDYRPRDERAGLWTDVRVSPDRVTFLPRPSHHPGHYAGLAASVFVLVFLVGPWLRQGLNPLELLVVGLLIWGAGAVAMRSFWDRRKPIVVALEAGNSTPDAGDRAIAADAVRAVILRENNGRFAEDKPLAQVYLDVAGAEHPLLVYQDRLDRAELAREKAERIADELGVPLEPQL